MPGALGGPLRSRHTLAAAAAGRPRAPEMRRVSAAAPPRGCPPAPGSWYRAEARGAPQRGGRGTAPPPCGRP
eukprot:scaffold9321_cov52-Phaeocystis_antarctica.AAC.1